METYQFRTSIPKSGIITIPKRIKENVLFRDVVVTIKKKGEWDMIDRLMC
ncbi:MAG: hypothetical protein V1749_07565 [Candidatus Desantisbacteria bacterium]